MSSPEESFDDRTRIFRRDDTVPVAVQEQFGHYLVVIRGTGLGLRLVLGTDPLTIGRDTQSSLVLASPDVSRRHCQVELVSGEVYVSDLNSTNGTYVDGKRIEGRTLLPDGSILELGQHVLKHERRSLREVQEAQELDRDLEAARNYGLSLLPPPILAGPVQTEWFIVPSAKVGGDAFGYAELDSGSFMIFLIDVSGHGIGAALLSVSILNVLRQRALPGTDFKSPSEVLANLNAMFRMEDHNDMFFTMWYGVYDSAKRKLVYASAGHHPAYLVSADRTSVMPLKTAGPLVGVQENHRFQQAATEIAKGASLHVFSDGVYEIEDKEGRQLGLSEFLPLLRQGPVEGRNEAQRIYQNVREKARPGPLDDDFSYLVIKFQ